MYVYDIYFVYFILVLYIFQIYYVVMYVGVLYYFYYQLFGVYVGYVFGKLVVEKVENRKISKDEKNSQKKISKSGDKFYLKLKCDICDEDEIKVKLLEKLKGYKKNKVVIVWLLMIYYLLVEIYDRLNIVGY